MLSNTAMNRVGILLRHVAPMVTRGSLNRQSPAICTVQQHLEAVRCAATFSTGSTSKASFQPLLPPQSERDRGRLTVVLDMDETLLHSHLVPLTGATMDPRSVDDHEDERAAHVVDRKPVDYTFEIGVGKNDRELVKSTLRPRLFEFLRACSQEFEPILLTSAMEIYARPLLDRIEKDAAARTGEEAFPGDLFPLFRHRLYRPSTVTLEGRWQFVKDVSRLGRDMSRVVLIDNSWAACVANPDNAIVVQDFLGETSDGDLPAVLNFLRHLGQAKDVRPELIRRINLRAQLEKAGVRLPKPTIPS